MLNPIDRKAKACNGLKGRSFVIRSCPWAEGFSLVICGPAAAGIVYRVGRYPIGSKLKHVLATIAYTPWGEHDGDDHALYLGKVQDFSYNNGDGLIFFQSRFLQTQVLKHVILDKT